MTVNRLESLNVRRVTQANALVADMVRAGSEQVNGRATANLSYPRHQSHFQASHPCGDARLLADDLGNEVAARRAGRPGSSVGVSVSRMPARPAGRTVLSEPSAAGAKVMATAAKPFGVLAKRPAVVGLDLRTNPLPSQCTGCAGVRGRQQAWRRTPTRGMPAVSTRGISALRLRPSRASSPASR